MEVSNFGNLRNVKNKRLYKNSVGKSGYCQNCISLGSRKDKKVFKRHKCVAENFIPNIDNNPEVNHIDGNKLNNHMDNLEWCTHAYNNQHAWNIGLKNSNKISGCNSYKSKFTKDEINFIRKKYIPKDKNFGCRALARKYKVHHKTIENIVNEVSYID